jgi:hypothetical protein
MSWRSLDPPRDGFAAVKHDKGCALLALACFHNPHSEIRDPQFFSLRFQDFDEGFLRNVDPPDALHPLFSFFLFLEQFPLPCDIAAIAFGGDVFA